MELYFSGQPDGKSLQEITVTLIDIAPVLYSAHTPPAKYINKQFKIYRHLHILYKFPLRKKGMNDLVFFSHIKTIRYKHDYIYMLFRR